jgi:hypothetical protein
LAETRSELRPVPSYAVRRFLADRPMMTRQTEGALVAAARLEAREVRSHEAEYVNGLWHWDAHIPERRVEPTSVDQRIAAALADGEQPRPFSELPASCRVRITTLYERLVAMTAVGPRRQTADGYSLASR